MTPIWTSKIGNTSRTLLLALMQDGALLDFDDLTGEGGVGSPQLRLRRPWGTEVVSVDVASFVDPETPAEFNAEVTFTDEVFEQLEAGIYLAEVDAELDGVPVTFPDSEYMLIRFLASLD